MMSHGSKGTPVRAVTPPTWGERNSSQSVVVFNFKNKKYKKTYPRLTGDQCKQVNQCLTVTRGLPQLVQSRLRLTVPLMAVVYFSLTTNLLKKYVYFSSFAIFIIFFLTQFEVNVNELTPGFDLLLFKSSLSGFQQHSVSMTTGSSVARGGSDTERDAETRHRHTHTYTCALVIRFLYLCRSVRGCRSMTMLD